MKSKGTERLFTERETGGEEHAKSNKKIFSGICIADADCIHDRFPCTIRVRCIPFVLQVYNGNRCQIYWTWQLCKDTGRWGFPSLSLVYCIINDRNSINDQHCFFCVSIVFEKIKGTNIFRTVFFMPNLIGGIVLGYVWQLLLNGILAHFQKTLTYSSKYGFWGLVILMLWQQVGYMMIIYISGIQNIPGELIEAAEIDGANKVQLLRYVTIPMVMPSITICTFLTLTNGFKLFDQNLALTNGGPDKMSEMLALNIYNTFYGRTGWEGVGQAKAVIFFIIVGVIALIQNKMTTSKEVQQ